MDPKERHTYWEVNEIQYPKFFFFLNQEKATVRGQDKYKGYTLNNHKAEKIYIELTYFKTQ